MQLYFIPKKSQVCTLQGKRAALGRPGPQQLHSLAERTGTCTAFSPSLLKAMHPPFSSHTRGSRNGAEPCFLKTGGRQRCEWFPRPHPRAPGSEADSRQAALSTMSRSPWERSAQQEERAFNTLGPQPGSPEGVPGRQPPTASQHQVPSTRPRGWLSGLFAQRLSARIWVCRKIWNSGQTVLKYGVHQPPLH